MFSPRNLDLHDLSHFKPKLSKIIEFGKFHQKGKGLTDGFWRIFDKYQTFEKNSKQECLAGRFVLHWLQLF